MLKIHNWPLVRVGHVCNEQCRINWRIAHPASARYGIGVARVCTCHAWKKGVQGADVHIAHIMTFLWSAHVHIPGNMVWVWSLRGHRARKCMSETEWAGHGQCAHISRNVTWAWSACRNVANTTNCGNKESIGMTRSYVADHKNPCYEHRVIGTGRARTSR